MSNPRNKPKRRKQGVAVQTLADEVLVYDLERHRAHCLNQVAAIVWRHSDGKTTVSQLARVLREELEVPADTELVRYAVDRLAKAHLLQDGSGVGRYSRREFIARLKKLGLAASVALPVVTSIVSPTPAHALSCVQESQCGAAGNCVPCYVGATNQCGTLRCCNGDCLPISAAQNACGC
jgi:hypothetical protein